MSATERATERPGAVRVLAVVFYVILLAGTYSFERLGLENPIVVPERLFALLVLFYFSVLLYVARGRTTAHGPVVQSLTMCLPAGYALVTGFWGPAVPDLWEVVTDLICIILSLACAALLIKWDAREFAVALLWCLLVSALVYSAAGLASSGLSTTRMAAFGGGPNVFARVTVLGVVAAVGLVALRRLPTAGLLLVPLFVTTTILSGSRGVMVGGLVGGFVLLPLIKSLSPSKVAAATAFVGVGVVAAYSSFADRVEAVINGRVIALTLEAGDSAGRDELVAGAVLLFRENPVIGAGLRGFAASFGRGFTYPHNLVLHAASEGGLIGVVILLGVIGTAASIIIRGRREPLVVVVASCATTLLVASMFSGDYYDTRFLWVFLLLAVNLAPLHKNRRKVRALDHPAESLDRQSLRSASP